ncbi:MAG: hypothetical protein ACI9BD_001321, partial [Candidatus Marinamargulisbacteria bacterium]
LSALGVDFTFLGKSNSSSSISVSRDQDLVFSLDLQEVNESREWKNLK